MICERCWLTAQARVLPLRSWVDWFMRTNEVVIGCDFLGCPASGGGSRGFRATRSARQMVQNGSPRAPLPPSACSRLTSFAVRIAALPPVAPRFARDRPFRACGRSPHCPRPFRAKIHVPSTPAGKRAGLRGVAAHPARFLRWPLAPGGLAARGWLSHRAISARRSRPKGRSRRRERRA